MQVQMYFQYNVYKNKTLDFMLDNDIFFFHKNDCLNIFVTDLYNSFITTFHERKVDVVTDFIKFLWSVNLNVTGMIWSLILWNALLSQYQSLPTISSCPFFSDLEYEHHLLSMSQQVWLWSAVSNLTNIYRY